MRVSGEFCRALIAVTRNAPAHVVRRRKLGEQISLADERQHGADAQVGCGSTARPVVGSVPRDVTDPREKSPTQRAQILCAAGLARNSGESASTQFVRINPRS